MGLDILTCGTIMIDILMVELKKVANPGEVVYLKNEPGLRIGGHPINVAINLVKLGIDRKKIGVIAAIGQGLFGKYAQKIIESYQVKTFLQTITTADTGVNIVLKEKDADRRFHIHPGANWFLDPKFVKDNIRKVSPKIFCIRPGYTGIDLHLEEIFEEAKKQDSFIFLDIMQFHPKRSPTLLCDNNLFRYVDAVHCNEEEAIVNTGKQTVNEAVEKILALGAKMVFLTKGENGAEIITNTRKISSIAYKTKTVDTTGCGDAFCAGAVYKMLGWKIYNNFHKLSTCLFEILEFAQAVGAVASTAVGCTEGVTRKKVDEILKGGK